MEKEQIRAEVDRISYRNEENGFSVVRMRGLSDGIPLTATGHFPALRIGEMYELAGTWSKHPTYGPQFKIEASFPIRPTEAKAIKRYLAGGFVPGIGPKTAGKIVDYFGDKTFEILDHAPDRLREVESIGRKKASKIIAAWRDQKSVSEVMVFLAKFEISPLFASKIYKLYGDDAITIVSEDPYRLAQDIPGVGFLSADRIARNMGIPPLSTERIKAAIVYHLKQGEDRGHCFLTSQQLLPMLTGALGVDQEELGELLPECLGELADEGMIFSERDGQDHYLGPLLAAEANIADVIQRMLDEPLAIDQTRVEAWLNRYCDASGIDLSAEQAEAVKQAAANRVFILTGGPGVGKTTTANTLIRLLKAMGRDVVLAAPTGRAAQRLSEVAALPAKTIHRLLEWMPGLGGFAKDETNTLSADVLIVDEASMLDVCLTDSLLRAMPKEGQIVFIGDIDQLPSVGPGQVLSDLMHSGRVPYFHLKKIFRQAAGSHIVAAAHDINQGLVPEVLQFEGGDCRFYTAETSADITEVVRNLLTDVIPRQYDCHPTRDVQILTPMNKGDLGTTALNETLQAMFNHSRPGEKEYKRGSYVLRPRDKVIQVSNNYELGVFNGDIGVVRETEVDSGKLLVQYGDRLVTYENEHALDLKLAYAITIHKSQGSEFPVVIIPVSMQHYIMLQRNLIYTALTRAKQLAIFIGATKALQYAVSNLTSSKRQTKLRERLAVDGIAYQPHPLPSPESPFHG